MAGTGKKKPPLVADKRRAAQASAKKRSTAKSTTTNKRRRAPAKRRGGLIGLITGLFRWIFTLIWRLLWRGAAVVLLLISAGVFYYYSTLPPVGELVDARAQGSVTMLDRDGAVYAWRGEQFGGAITPDTISPNLTHAIVATEDKRFYSHFGVSPRGVAGAIKINLSEGRGALSGHGGSTITQQTAKLLCLGVPFDPAEWKSETEYEADCRRGSMSRKIKEAIYAMGLEARYTKDEILTIYLNRAFLGAGARGFEAAAQRYFGKSAASVDPAEAAMLAGLLVAPTRYAPTNDLERSQRRAQTVLNLMQEQGYLTAAQAEQARIHPAELSAAAEARAGGYFADWVMDQGPDFLTRDTTEDVILRTTFDGRMQKAAESALDYVFETKLKEGSKAQAAIVVMSSDGAVRAMVGGRKFKGVAGQFNRAIMAKRQTGSSFKPFVYAAALELGYSANDTVLDAPLTLNIPGSGPWSPKNYSRNYQGNVTLTEALKQSLNTAAVRVSESVGRENVRKVAEGFGIESDLAAGPALALGASESTLLEMTGAFAGILNGGTSVEPYGILELRLMGDDTPLIGQDGGLGERVISREAAEQLTYMMYEVVQGGTGRRAALDDREAAGKSGTTQAARDAWFLGFTADYVAGVWMGYDDNTPLSGVTGGGLPAEIWHEVMLRVHEGLPVTPLPMRRPVNPLPAQLPDDINAVRSDNAAPAPQPVPQPIPQPVPVREPDLVERIIDDVLGGLFGRRN
ncbi:transglycosylase domain-containing protein [Oceaniovalibus sp. ACAM 378]|uniref:transglycosylase domain-containing protein n=1 Tax=Oceaniovalibus sp. ACAM 378 TaxID=2599923 RepID=UPI0011DB696A|nr:PBP1A family penicillin-binding protein [Oceaniovalibus sp. ACAM 378]TYB88414.1 PBP1A family penicillin-binding protein [Oceaniovalibus sp. ACAM 378]